MTSSNDPSRSADQDDPWEQLADQFGLETGKEYTARESDSPESDSTGEKELKAPPPAELQSTPQPLPKDDPLPLPAPRDEPPRFASEAVPDVKAGAESFGEVVPAEGAAHEPVSPQDSYWDALANWNWDESEGGQGKSRSEPRPAEPRHSEPPRPEPSQSQEPRSEQSRSEQSRSEHSRPEHSRPDRRRSGGGPPPRGGSRRRDEGRGRRGEERRGEERPGRQPATRPPASAPTPPPPSRSQRQTEAADSDDFGSGLAGDSPGFSAPMQTSDLERSATYNAGDDETLPATGDSLPAAAEPRVEREAAQSADPGGQRPGGGDRDAAHDGPHPRKRRRRRRRRGGRGGEEPSATASVPGSEWGESAGPEEDAPEAASGFEEALIDDDDDEDGPQDAGFEEGPVAEADHDSDELDGDEESGDEESGDEESGDEESGDEQSVSYENIPSWEEAISYLLHPDQVQVEPVAGGGGSKPPRGPQPADQPRQTRHIGHRKHRR